MKPLLTFVVFIFLCLGWLGCNQTFEPEGPVNNKLVLYSILASQTDTQYVRLSTTYGSSPVPDVKGALVQLVGPNRTLTFKDTTVQWLDAQGNFSPTNVYVAYHAPVVGGQQYELQASTITGLTASANATPVSAPSFVIHASPTPGYFTLDTRFATEAGAFVMRFYVDFYALVEGGFEFHREEVPTGSSVDQAGNVVLTYPQLSLVALLSHNRGTIPIKFDSAAFNQTVSRILTRYPGGVVVFLQIAFSLTQIDDVLYSYYYFNNGPVDKSTIRLDQPDFTNVANGFGVVGSRVQVNRFYRLNR